MQIGMNRLPTLKDLFSNHTARRINYAASLQLKELKSDWIFFGVIGLILGVATNAIVRAQEKGLKLSLAASNDLLSDFMSVKAHLLILSLLILVCSIRNLWRTQSPTQKRLAVMATHSAKRLRQLGSSITCFGTGYSFGLMATVIGSFDSQALLLSILVLAVGTSASAMGILGTAIYANIGVMRTAWGSTIAALATLLYLLKVFASGFN